MSYTYSSYCLTRALQGLTLTYRIHHNKKEGGREEAEGLLAIVDDVALLHHHQQLPLDPVSYTHLTLPTILLV